jgi:hypothetical protein
MADKIDDKQKVGASAPAADAAKAPEKKEPPKPLDEKAAGNFIGRFMAKTEPVAVEKKPDDAKPEDGKKPDDKAKPEDKKPAKKPKKETPVEAPAPLTADDLSAATAAAVRVVLDERDKPKAEEKQPDPDENLPEEHKRTVRILERMEKDKGDKYKGLPQKYREFLDELVTYAEKWETDHPGKQFNEDDEEHSEFFAKQPEWDDEDYTDAVADIKLDQRLGAEREETAKKLSVLEKQEKFRQAIPKIRSVKVSNARTYFSQMGDQFKDLLKEDGSVDKAVEQKAMDADPITAQIVISGANTVETYTGDCHALFNNVIDYNAKNPVHAQIANFALEKERQLLKKTPKEQRDEKGRRFVPAADYWKMPEADRQKCWTFSENDVNLMLTAAIVKQTKQQIQAEEDKFARRAKARGLDLNGSAADKAKENGKVAEEKVVEKKPEDEEEEIVETEKPRSPSAAPGPRGAGAEIDKNKPAEGVTKFVTGFLGKAK